jgi:DnaJ-class molecular chaperone
MFFQKQHDSKYYDVLGVNKNDSPDELRKAYKKLAMEYHPDRGGDVNKFKELTKAYEVLSDPDKRAHYDMYGEDNQQSQSHSHYSQFPFPFHPQQRQNTRTVSKDTEVPIITSLEQIYNGYKKELIITRKILDKESVSKCGACNGEGSLHQRIQLGGMIQISSQTCPTCLGKGQSVSYTQIKENITVHIDKGMPNNHRVVLTEKSNEEYGMKTGNVLINFIEKDHDYFKRDKANLIYRKTINLQQAITGTSFSIKHLDSRTLWVTLPPGVICQPHHPQDWRRFHNFNVDDVDMITLNDITEDKLANVVQVCYENNYAGFIWDTLKHTAVVKKNMSRDMLLDRKIESKNTVLYIAPYKNDIMVVKEEGLPVYNSSNLKGDLFIEFDIHLPETLTDDQMKLIRKILNSTNSETKPDGDNVVECNIQSIKSINTNPDIDKLYENQQSNEQPNPTMNNCSQQ